MKISWAYGASSHGHPHQGAMFATRLQKGQYILLSWMKVPLLVLYTVTWESSIVISKVYELSAYA